MSARIEITEVEARTKIRARYLRAIENEEWDLLPGPVYAKTFLRTYADFLGLDSRALVDEYKQRYERPSDHEIRPVSSMNRERKRGPRGPLVPPWAIIGVVLVGVVVALYLVGTSSGPSTPTTSTQAGTAHHRVRHRHKPRPAPRPQPTTVTLQLKPTASVYVCLVDGQGKALIPGQIFSPGQAIPTKSAPKMKLTLGNASVQMKVNGSVVKVNPSSTSIGFLLQPSGSTSLPTSQQPRCA